MPLDGGARDPVAGGIDQLDLAGENTLPSESRVARASAAGTASLARASIGPFEVRHRLGTVSAGRLAAVAATDTAAATDAGLSR